MEGETSRCGQTYFVAGQHKNSERVFLTRGATNIKGNPNPVQQYLGRLQQWCFPRVEFPLRRHFPVYRWQAYFKLCLVYPDRLFFSQPRRHSRTSRQTRRIELPISRHAWSVNSPAHQTVGAVSFWNSKFSFSRRRILKFSRTRTPGSAVFRA